MADLEANMFICECISVDDMGGVNRQYHIRAHDISFYSWQYRTEVREYPRSYQ